MSRPPPRSAGWKPSLGSLRGPDRRTGRREWRRVVRHVSACHKATCSLDEQERVRSFMKHFKVNLFVGVVAAVLIPLLLAPAVAQAQAAPWTVVPSPNASPGNNE